MRYFVGKIGDDFVRDTHVEHDCGTTACLAGWAGQLMKLDGSGLLKRRRSESQIDAYYSDDLGIFGYEAIGADILGLTKSKPTGCSRRWTPPISGTPSVTGRSSPRKQAITVLKHLRDKGEVDWTSRPWTAQYEILGINEHQGPAPEHGSGPFHDDLAEHAGRRRTQGSRQVRPTPLARLPGRSATEGDPTVEAHVTIIEPDEGRQILIHPASQASVDEVPQAGHGRQRRSLALDVDPLPERRPGPRRVPAGRHLLRRRGRRPVPGPVAGHPLVRTVRGTSADRPHQPRRPLPSLCSKDNRP